MHGHFLILSTANRLSQKEQTRVGVGGEGGGGVETTVETVETVVGLFFEVFIVGNILLYCCDVVSVYKKNFKMKSRGNQQCKNIKLYTRINTKTSSNCYASFIRRCGYIYMYTED